MRRAVLVTAIAITGCSLSGGTRPAAPATFTLSTVQVEPPFELVERRDGLYLETPDGPQRVEPDGPHGARVVPVETIEDRSSAMFPALLPHSIPAFGTSIDRAWLSEPTDRYDHGALGDDLEAATLNVAVDGETVFIRAGEDAVFEDLHPRLADFDGDGTEEVFVVRTVLDAGASIAIFNADGTEHVSSEPIGRRFRWLNPVGAADLDADGTLEIAWVERPHLDATLTVASVTPGGFELRDTRPGHSNHAPGSTSIRQSFIAGERIVVPAEDRTRLAAFVLSDGDLVEVADVPLSGTLSTDLFQLDNRFVFGVDSNDENRLVVGTIGD